MASTWWLHRGPAKSLLPSAFRPKHGTFFGRCLPAHRLRVPGCTLLGPRLLTNYDDTLAWTVGMRLARGNCLVDDRCCGTCFHLRRLSPQLNSLAREDTCLTSFGDTLVWMLRNWFSDQNKLVICFRLSHAVVAFCWLLLEAVRNKHYFGRL